MFRPGGYAFTFDVCGVRQEADTFTCAHCNTVVVIRPKCDPTDLGGLCRICDKMVCPTCVDKGVCDPIEEKLLREENAYHARRSYGI